ncbi:ucp10 [Candida oxycetoniae]|uniref:Ucp10 n=1 Tax=Candida oxycetoniae TaxID=497107 RepID=A0AAI9T054_9ASCO|nr:ucp10 [Candida oxycetoniae]KAI3405580.2 ucp10 [Candida oxycetoniae]
MPWSSRLRAIFGDRNRHRLGTNDNSNNNTNEFPGSFPGREEDEEEEGIEQVSRNSTNSHAFRESMHKIGGWVTYLLIQPIIIIVLILFRLLSKLISIIYLDPSKLNRDELTDPIDKVCKFVRNLEDNIPPSINSFHHNQLPPFFEGSYTQALYMATQRGKFLFIYLTNSHNESASFIFNEIVINPEFIRIFTSSNNNVIIWGGDLTNPEAYQLANSLNVTKFPFLGLLCLTRITKMTPEGPQKEPSKMSLVAKLQGGGNITSSMHNGADLIKSKFVSKINKYEPELILIRRELKDKFMTEVLKKQQEYNYLQSLQKDMLKKAEKLNEAKTKEYLEYRAPDFLNLTVQAPDTAKIALKFPNSTRQTVYFPKTMKVEDIYIYVELYKQKMLNGKSRSRLSTAEAESKFSNFQMKFNFKLSSPLPPRTDLSTKRSDLIENIDLIYPNGLLLIEDE